MMSFKRITTFILYITYDKDVLSLLGSMQQAEKFEIDVVFIILYDSEFEIKHVCPSVCMASPREFLYSTAYSTPMLHFVEYGWNIFTTTPHTILYCYKKVFVTLLMNEKRLLQYLMCMENLDRF